jgi:hypothetical protein
MPHKDHSAKQDTSLAFLFMMAILGARVLDWSRAQVAVMKPGPAARALHAIIQDLMNTRDGATYFAGRVWGVSTHYNLGDDHPLVGHSVPNFELEDGTKIGEYMHDGQWILLDFNSDAPLKTWASEEGDQIKYVSGRSKEQFGLSALLIRPDGIISRSGPPFGKKGAL